MNKFSFLTALLLSTLSLAVHAQSETEAGDDDAAPLDKITVTGTHIRGIDLEGAQQIVTIDRDQIESSGATNVIQLLQELPQAGGGDGTFSTATAGALSNDSPPGAAGVSLRGLGTASTLTLVNGRRVAVSSFANGSVSFVDVNSIPLAAIERVEVLLGGASAVYGADAVAGVVNFILRDDYDGLQVSGSYGDSTASTDESKWDANLVWGTSGDRHNFTVILDHFERNALYDRDRAETATEIRPRQQGIYPSFNDLFFMFFDQTEEPQDGGCPADQFVPDGVFGEYCELDRGQFVSTQDEFESTSATALLDVDLGDDLRWFSEFMYVSNESRGTSSPAPFSRQPVDPARPDWPSALVQDIVDEGFVDGIEDYFGFPIFAWGSFPDPRQVGLETDNWRAVTGLEGAFGDTWTWEGAFSYGESETTQRGLAGLYKTLEFRQALLGNLCSDGSFGGVWEDVLDRNPAFVGGATCEDLGLSTVYYNPFNGQAGQDPLVDDLIRTQAVRNGESSVWAIDGRVSGDLFQLPNGMYVSAAFGFEHREEEVKDLPSSEARATPDNPEPIVRFSFTEAVYERSQDALYGEFFVPVTDRLELQLAGRYDDYDDFGSDFNPKIGFRWGLTDTFALRGNWSTAFRAPSLAQAGAGTTLSSAAINCDAPGVAPACGGASEGALSILTENLGNPDLEAEESESWGLGFLWQLTPDATVTLDWWSIDHENLVGLDEEDFIRRALAGEFEIRDFDLGDDPLPEGTPGLEFEGGVLVEAHVPLLNFGFQETEGLDATYTQNFDIDDHEFRFRVNATYLADFTRQISVASPIEDLAGEFRYPEFRSAVSLDWGRGDWESGVQWYYVGSYTDDLEGLRSDTLEEFNLDLDNPPSVDSWSVFDAYVSYYIGDDNRLTLSVDNLLDEDAPLVFGSAAGVDFINHSTMGRFWTLRYTHNFR